MWVLSTDRAELHSFASPEDIKDGYAILSHTWNKPPGDEPPEDGPPEQSPASSEDTQNGSAGLSDTWSDTPEDGPPEQRFPSPEETQDGSAALSNTCTLEDRSPEQTFKEVLEIQKKCDKDGTNPRDSVSEKIRRCCELAEKHGYKWVWIDTCCIDKESSAELSEAINSMFRYYALAAICYGYLRDVNAAFFSLKDLENYRQDLESDRQDLEDDRHSPHPYDHERYGELVDSNWFRRGWTLQELIAPRFFVFLSLSWVILGTKADLAELLEYHFRIPAAVLRYKSSHTEFSIAERMSWFQNRETTRPEDEAYCLLGLFDIHMPPLYGEGRNAFRRLQEEIMKQSADTTLFAWKGHVTEFQECLFAASPANFFVDPKKDGIVYTPPRRTADAMRNESALGVPADVNKMTFAVTPTGIRANIPIFQWEGKTFADLYWSSANGSGRRVFLHLELDLDSQASSFHSLSYQVGHPRLTGTGLHEGIFDVRPPDGPPSWKEVLIRHRPPPRRAPGQLPDSAMFDFTPAIPMQLTFDAPFRFPEARIRQFMEQSNWYNRLEIRGAGLHPPWRPTEYVFRQDWDEFCAIRVGQCQKEPGEQHRFDAIWATFTSISLPRFTKDTVEWETLIGNFSTDTIHDCSQDHVSQWPGLRKTFELDIDSIQTAQVTLSFTRCPLNPERTLILDASLWSPGPLIVFA